MYTLLPNSITKYICCWHAIPVTTIYGSNLDFKTVLKRQQQQHKAFINLLFGKIKKNFSFLTLILTAWEFKKAFFVKMKISPGWLKQNIF
jgi:hypothetical protein